MKLYKLILRTPEETVFEGLVSSVTLMQSDGYRSFWANHESCIGDVAKGVNKYVDENGESVNFVTVNGFFTIKNGTLTINSSIIAYGDDYEEVMEGFAVSSSELRKKYVKSKQEYTQSKIEVAKALVGKKPDVD